MEETDPHGENILSEKHRLRVGFWILPVLLVLLIGGIIILNKKVTLTTIAEVPLVSTTLPDGATFEVLQAEAGASYTFTSRRPEPTISISRVVSVSTRFTHGWSFFDFEFTSKKTALDQVECRLKDRDCNALFLLVRLKNPSGDEMISDHVIFDETEAPVKVEWDKNNVFKGIEMVPRSTHPAPHPLYQVEVEDGAGGWLTTNGPLAFDGLDGRSVVIATVYPRKNPKLKFRIVRNDVAHSFIVEIPNPGHPPKLDPNWKADPEPWEYKTSDAAIAVTEVRPLNVSKLRNPIPNPKFLIRPHADQPPTASHVQILSIEDSMGNRTPIEQFRLLPGESILQYHCLIRRSRMYQWSIPEVTIVAEGTWSGGSSAESLDLLPAALDFGIAEMTIAPAPSAKTNEWIFSCRGKVAPANLPDRGFVVFFDGDESPRVASRPFAGGSTGPTAGERTYQFTGEWEGRTAPGQRFRLGLVPETNPEYFQSTLPVPPKFLKSSP